MTILRQVTTRGPVSVGLAVAAALLVVGFVVTMLLPTSYSATGVVALVPRPQVDVSAETVTLISGAYVAYLSSPEVAARAAQMSGADPARAQGDTEVTVDSGTTNIRVRSTLPTAKGAADNVNALLNMATAKAANDPLLSADPVSPALDEAAEANPPRSLLLLIIVLSSVIVGGAISFILTQRSRRDR